MTRENCVPTKETGPQRRGHSAPLLPQVLLSQTVSLLLTFWKPRLQKGMRPSVLVGGNGRERQAFEICKGMAAWETLFKPRTEQAYGSVWPPRRKGYWVGLHRLQAEPQDPETADLMGFPYPTRQRRSGCSKCWRITVACILGMLVKHMRNYNLGDLRSASHPSPPHKHIIGSCQALQGESSGEKLSVPVLTWQSSLRLRRKNPHTPGWGLRILCITQPLK